MILLLVSFGVGVQAEVSPTHFAGSICKAHYGSQQDRLIYYAGSVYNNSDYITRVICPLDKDYISTNADICIKTYVTDKHPDIDFTCTFFSMKEDWSNISSADSGDDILYTELPWTAQTHKLFMYCRLPPKNGTEKSGIERFFMVYDDSDDCAPPSPPIIVE
jgi:hypothetical protein